MNSLDSQWFSDCRSCVDEALVYCSIARDFSLQKVMRDKLRQKLADCSEQNEISRRNGDEDICNLLLGFECAFDCLSNELEMWLLLKESKPNEGRLCT